MEEERPTMPHPDELLASDNYHAFYEPPKESWFQKVFLNGKKSQRLVHCLIVLSALAALYLCRQYATSGNLNQLEFLTLALNVVIVTHLVIAFYFHSKIRCSCMTSLFKVIHGLGRFALVPLVPYLIYRFAWPWIYATWGKAKDMASPTVTTEGVAEAANSFVSGLYWTLLLASFVAAAYLLIIVLKEFFRTLRAILRGKHKSHFKEYTRKLKNIIFL